MTEGQAFVFEAYATGQALKNRKKREHFQAREDKRHTLFGRFGTNKAKSNRYDPLAVAAIQGLDDSVPLVEFDSATRSTDQQRAIEAPATASSIIQNNVATSSATITTAGSAAAMAPASRTYASKAKKAVIGDQMQE